MTSLSIHAAARELPDAPALITADRTLTFADAARLAAHHTPLTERASIPTILAIYAALESHLPIAFAPIPAVPAGTLAVLFTSGSTGTPKGVILSRAAFLAAARMSAAHLGTAPDDRHLLCLPLHHTGGLGVVLRALVARQPLIVHDAPFDPAAVATLARRHRATLASLVPAQLDALAHESLPDLRAVLVGGAATSPAILDRARAIPYLRTYGMTETWGQVATARVSDAGRPDAPLIPLPGITVHAGTPDAPAPISIETPAAMTGYLGAAPHTGPILTADLGSLRYVVPHVPRTAGATYLQVVGRVDDVIVTGGEKVHPAQVEAAVSEAPGVREACAFGVPDEKWGQLVACAIVGEEIDLERVRAHVAAMPSHLRPRRLEIVEELPVLASGKIDRRALQLRLASR